MAVPFRALFCVLVTLVALSFELTESFMVPLETLPQNLDRDVTKPMLHSSNIIDVTEAPSKEGTEDCPWCQGRHETPNKHKILTDSDLRQLRLELVKAKILSRLNLTEVPKGIRERNKFPSLVTEGKVPGASIYDNQIEQPEEAVFPSIVVAESKIPCSHTIKSPSSCFKFPLENVSGKDPVTRKAQLWIWKLHYEGNETPQLITISQIRHSSNSEYQDRLISYYASNTTSGWISINISWTTPSTDLIQDTTNLYLRISCPNCKGRKSHQPVSSSYDHRPFLVTKEAPSTYLNNNRFKRSTGECSDTSERCCRDSLYVDFDELGWSNWILQPSGFTMYYCRGSCNYASVNATGNTYIGLLHRLMRRPNITTNLKEAISPCCAAGHKEALSVLWVPGRRSPVRVSRLQDMIVKSCDCFG